MSERSDGGAGSGDHSHGIYALVVPWELEHPGGVNQVVMNLYDELEQLSPGVPWIVIKSWESSRLWQGQVAGRRTWRWRFRDPVPARNRAKAGALFWLGLPVASVRLFAWMRREQVDVVNVHYPGPWLIPLAVLRVLAGRPRCFLLSLHGLDLHEAEEAYGLRKRLWRFVLRSADRIPCCSKALAAQARDAFPEVADRIEAVPNGVNAEAIRATARTPEPIAERLGNGRRYIASVATFEAKKGQDVLIRAFAVLAKERPQLDLILAGREGDTLERNRRLASELGLSSRVRFLPNLEHDEALGVIRGASVFALPSRREPFGIVVLEAGALGVPVIATRVGGVPEIVVDGEHGHLVPPEDPAALAGAIADVLDDPESAEHMASALEQRVLETFTWRRVAQRYQEIAECGPLDADATGRRGEKAP